MYDMNNDTLAYKIEAKLIELRELLAQKLPKDAVRATVIITGQKCAVTDVTRLGASGASTAAIRNLSGEWVGTPAVNRGLKQPHKI